MIQVTIVGFDYALGTAVMGLNDLLSLCGVTWNRVQNLPPTPHFKVTIASEGARPICCLNQLHLLPHAALEDTPPADILIVPTIAGNIEKTLVQNPAIIRLLQSTQAERTFVASNCTGAFFLAEAGLLNGKDATTHWGFVDKFRKRYPNVNLKPEQLITESDNLLCAGGGHAWFDLGLYLIERFCGREVALETAKAFVIDMGRQNQMSYSPLDAKKQHSDLTIKNIQYWIDQHFTTPFVLDEIAREYGLSVRTLIRRFKQATGETPIAYAQAVRMEQARKLLETRSLSIAHIAHQVGYEDISSFSRLFKQMTGLTPGHYRARYKSRMAGHMNHPT